MPLQLFFARHRVHFHQANVTGVSVDGRVVHTDQGDLANDGLMIASGGRFIKKLPGIEYAITPCEALTRRKKSVIGFGR